jgi:DNA polymerase-3 subunit gamma/tau
MKSGALYRRLRPKHMKDVVGQSKAVEVLSGMVKKGVPNAVIFQGPSGCGKTTLARWLAGEVGCKSDDLEEVNCAKARGIDMVRQISDSIDAFGLYGEARVYLLDEVHRLTSDAQSALLKIMEDTPEHAFFFLCTTDNHKLLRTIITRCTPITLNLVKPKDLKLVLERAYRITKCSVQDEVEEKIIELAEGSPRMALVLLEAALAVTDPEKQLEYVINAGMGSLPEFKELAGVIFNLRSRWADVANVLKDIQSDAEELRRKLLGYAAAILLKSPEGSKIGTRSYIVLDRLRDDFYSSGKSGLVLALYEVFHADK